MKIQFKAFLWWYFSNHSRLLPHIKLNCNLKISNLQTVKTVSPTWLLISSKMSLVICIFLWNSLKKVITLTYKCLFRYEVIHETGTDNSDVRSKSKTDVHSCNEALSLKYSSKAKQFIVLNNTPFFLSNNHLNLGYIWVYNIVEQTHYIYKMWHISMGQIFNE